MASIIHDPDRKKRLLVILDRKRWTIRLGEVTKRDAESIKQKVEALVAARTVGMPPDAETSRWLASIDPKLHERIAKTGLVPSRQTVKVHTLGDLLSAYFENLSVKDATAVTYAQSRRVLEEHFGTERELDSITPLDAARWRQSLVESGLAEPTIAKRVKTARQILKAGQKWGMVTRNPFADLKAGAQSNRTRMHYVTREEAARVLEACPDSEWRLIFALARFAGLRTPSETLALRWRDIDWHKGRMTVWSCKTEGHEGQEFRVVPLFEDLRPYLQEAFDQADEGAEYVITRARDASVNLRSQMLKTIRRAGLKPWPKVYQNLRSTRQSELTEIYPTHVVCAWMGNSTQVAHQHYLQVRTSTSRWRRA